jgi:hypothetical protein
MSCPPDANTGFVELVGPILVNDLTNISINSSPLSISFAPRTTPPTLIGNRIDESTENTCTYKGQRFSLVDVQICNPTHKGYILPGDNEQPVAELMLSFSNNKSAQNISSLSGILLSIPIYDTGTPNHDEYIMQFIDVDIPSCKYTNVVGTEYKGGDYKSYQGQTLNQCIKMCCDDPSCLAYTYDDDSCFLKNTIPNLIKNDNKKFISGTVSHTEKTKPICKTQEKKNTKDKKAKVPTLESIFYAVDNDKTQESLAYKTCFETIDENQTMTSKSIYIVVFPKGIHISPQAYQQLLIQIGIELQPYMMPPAIRGADSTVRSYKFDDDGRKVPTIISKDGILYRTPLSSCTDDFKNRFEHFKLPPQIPNSKHFNTEKCPYYKTTQYKCVPFNQLKDLSGNYVVPGNKTLDTILYEQNQAIKANTNGTVPGESTKVNNQITTEQIETFVGVLLGTAIAGLVAIKVGSWISKSIQ